MNRNLIKDYFKNFKKITFTSVKKFKEQYNNEYYELEEVLKNQPKWVSIQNVIIGIIENKTLKKCKTCGTIIPFSKWDSDYCCIKCVNNDPNIKMKIKNTCLEKYGVENAAKSKIIKEKSKQTCLEKYGVENAAKSKIIKEKSRQTCLEKYGVEFTTQTIIMKEKSKQTCLEKYGVEHYTNIPKQINSTFEKSFKKFLNFENVEPLFSLEEYTGINYKKLYKWKCKKCGNIFEDHMHSHMPRCQICYPKTNNYSNQEKDVLSFIKSIYKGKIIENDRNLIKPFELDIVIPELKLAFEYNGDFWHSTSSPGYFKNKNRDFEKMKLCERLGFQLIQIKEHDWMYKNEIVKNNLRILLDTKLVNIIDEDLIIKKLDNDTFKEFSKNYLLNSDRSSIKIGCYYNNDLISCITFEKNKKYYKICNIISSIINLTIFEKILSYFEKEYNTTSIKAVIDKNNIFLTLFEKIGFDKIGELKPQFYFYKNDNNILYTENQCRNLKKILKDNYDPNISTSENMANNGFLKLFNNGYSIFNRININK